MAPEQTTNDSMSNENVSMFVIIIIIMIYNYIGLPPNKEPYESTDQPFEPQKESTDYEAIALDEPQSVSPTRDIIYDSVYATPVDVQRDADFDNQIPSINPVTKGDFWSYVNSNNMKAFQQEFRVMNPWLTVSLMIAFKFKADNKIITLHLVLFTLLL